MQTPSLPRTGASLAMRQLLAAQLEDHRLLRQHYRDYGRSVRAADPAAAEAAVNQAIDLLSVHGAIERELLYPAARQALRAATPCDLLEAENALIDSLIDAVCFVGPRDEGFPARFEQLCLLAMRHGLEEEARLFPLLAASPACWRELADAVQHRRQQLLAGAPPHEARAFGPEADEPLHARLM